MNAVEQAVDLLQRRRNEARTEIDALRIEVEQIERALASLRAPLTVNSVGTGTSQASLLTAPVTLGGRPDYSKLSIIAAVRLVLDGARGPWSPTLIREQLEGTGVRGNRDDEGFIAAIRTALHSLRNSGEARLVENKMTVSAKWFEDAEAPAATGASETEESSDGSSRQEGDSRVEAAISPRGGDHDPDYPGRDHHLGRGAPLAG